MSPGAKFRAALAAPDLTVIPAIYNGATARLAESAGFPALLIGGSAVTNTLLGMADAGYLTLTEMEFMVSRAAAAVSIPILADVDTGYGNAVSVIHTVRTIERSGAGALMIEDQVSPPRTGHVAGSAVVSTEEFVGKIKACVDTRRDREFFILARTDARRVLGLDEAIERGHRYAEAGADGFLVDGLLAVDEMERVGREMKGLTLFTGISGSSKKRTTPKIPLPELSRMGYPAAFLGLQSLRAGALEAFNTLQAFRESGPDADAKLDAAFAASPLAGWFH
jgi:2-methylisocitrate lyase-like PEP mutase family enzyme